MMNKTTYLKYVTTIQEALGECVTVEDASAQYAGLMNTLQELTVLRMEAIAGRDLRLQVSANPDTTDTTENTEDTDTTEYTE